MEVIRLRPLNPMRRLSLSSLLIAVNVGLVLVAVLCVVASSTRLLRRLADEQALARAQLAGVTALHVIDQAGEEAAVSARLLCERPTLARLLATRDAAGLADFLDRFARTGNLTGCALLLPEGLFARGGGELPRLDLAALPRDSEGRFLLREGARGPLFIGAAAPVRDDPRATVIVYRRLDEPFVQAVAQQVGLPVRILGREEILEETARWDAGGAGAHAALRARVVEAEHALTVRLDGAGLYASVIPLRDPGGAVLGIVETDLPMAEISASVGRLTFLLLVLAVGVAALAMLLSVLLARSFARPLEELARASARIGHGDLDTPIRPSGGVETGTLAATMEEMRTRLLHLSAEQRRRKAEADAIVAGIAEGIFAVDRERRLRFLNPQAAAMLGVKADEAIGRFCGDVLNPKGPDGERPCESNCPIIHARVGGTAMAVEHLQLPHGARRTVVINSSHSEHEDAAGHEASAERGRQFQVMRDETDIETARRMRDAVLANISHEFRTPLSAQLASIELLRDKWPELAPPEARQLILALERGALRLTQLIDNLLESVRIESGELSIRLKPVALDEVVEEAVQLVMPLIEQRSQTLSIELPYPIPAVEGDAPRMIQVLVNLLANASKFSPSGGAIRIGGEAGVSQVTLWVEDEGSGMPGGFESSAFEPFVRLDSSAGDDEPEPAGMGLGLFIAKSIVERHGGKIVARPRPPDGSPGTRMCVVLPVEGGGESSRRR